MPPKRIIAKRSVLVQGHKTSVSLEEEFWSALQEVADRGGFTVPGLLGAIDETRGPGTNLSSAIRVHVLKALREERR